MGGRRYQYLVEGETEKKLINELKKEGDLILSGTVNHFNIVDHRLSNAIRATIKNGFGVDIFKRHVKNAIKEKIETRNLFLFGGL